MIDFLIDLDQEEYKIENLTTLSYEELSQWAVGEAVIKAAVNRWSALGFLDGITDKNKRDILAVAYDNIAYDLLTENKRVVGIKNRYDFNCNPGDEKEHEFSFDVIVFPLLRRLICGVTIGKTDYTTNRFHKPITNFNYKKFLDYLEDFELPLWKIVYLKKLKLKE